MQFLKEDYLLNSDTAKKLYEYARKMPIIDYHCHLSPKEIYEDKKFDTITELWLGGDHYKWRLMRAYGMEEDRITGKASDKEKFLAWAETLALAIGNPLYEWSHLELKNYFAYEGVLNETTAEEVWKLCNEKLKEYSARSFIRNSHVEVVCTTDDPIDDLHYHQLMAQEDMGFKVYPAWRPDKIVAIEKEGWSAYLRKLEEVSGSEIKTSDDLVSVLIRRMDYFADAGCKVADHGMGHVPFAEYQEDEINTIFRKRINSEALNEIEIEQYKTAILYKLNQEYARRNWVSQLHCGVKRDNSSFLLDRIGNDAGGDHIGDYGSVDKLADFLDLLDREDSLPKTIVYSLNPNDNIVLDTVIGTFQRAPVKSKLQHGSAWWFNDNFEGMYEQLKSVATQGHLAGFVGMLTDSRSFVSYARHEYFRKVLCRFLGDLVENGRFPDDDRALKKLVEDISYYNAKEYFGF